MHLHPQHLLAALPFLSCAPLSWSRTWNTLGPFSIGTREAEWGADPLSHPKWGGFSNLFPSNTSERFASALGEAGWVALPFKKKEGGEGEGSLDVKFEQNVDWKGVRQTYGWAGAQFQAWVRGALSVPSCAGDVDVALWITGAMEARVDGVEYFGGDVFGFRRAPLVVRLKEGEHTVEVRVAHDVRAFGGVDEVPVVNVGLRAEIIEEAERMRVVDGGCLTSDVVEGRMVGEWVGVTVGNWDAQETAEIVGVEGDGVELVTSETEGGTVRFAPGQTRPVKVRLEKLGMNGTKLEFRLKYRRGESAEVITLPVICPLDSVEKWSAPQKFTFQHPSGIVSYAVLRPPSPNSTCPPSSSRKLPILLSLHGAGVSASSPQSRESFAGVPDLCAWLLLPSGVTTWSGDDWHRWGFADAEAAIESIPAWMQTTNWTRQGIDIKKWLVTGHSNGGQGAWYALTHRPDRIIAAAPLSGYLSIPQYVPYTQHHASAPPHTRLRLAAALSTYDHSLLSPNAVGPPLLLQHGSADDNVPAYHSRLMHQLLSQSGAGAEISYNEVRDAPHWWPEVQYTPALKEFYETHLSADAQLSRLPNEWTTIVACAADMGARGGIKVDQLHTPGVVGIVTVKIDGDNTWLVNTRNIRRWHFEPRPGTGVPKILVLNGLAVSVHEEGTYLHSLDTWTWLPGSGYKKTERYGLQQCSLDAILSSHAGGPFIIHHPPSSPASAITQQIARNLYTYYAADTLILPSPPSHGNIIDLRFGGEKLEIGGKTWRTHPGMGAVFLEKAEGEGVRLVVWGADDAGLRRAARLVPARTGVGAPEAVVVWPRMDWIGAGGTEVGVLDWGWRWVE